MIKIGICQIKTTNSKEGNINKAKAQIESLKNDGAQIIILPEIFNTEYNSLAFLKEGEKEGGVTYSFLKKMSKDVILIGGSITEIGDDSNRYNTSFIFENEKQLGKHRKMHLFDVDFNSIKLNESSYFKPGDKSTIVKTSLGNIGVAICFDIRFPELFTEMKKEGDPFLYVVPGSFNQVTGPAHQKLLSKARALDAQSFLAFVSCASNKESNYDPYGHSMVIDPWGNVIDELDELEQCKIIKIKEGQIKLFREQLPLKR